MIWLKSLKITLPRKFSVKNNRKTKSLLSWIVQHFLLGYNKCVCNKIYKLYINNYINLVTGNLK